MNSMILIIEDNPDNYYLMKYLLENAGYSIIWAENGMAGIEMALKEMPLAILLDIQLPLMDGYSVAAELRKHSVLSGIPIIAVTSYAMVGDKERVLAAGATAYMEKPIDPDTFITEITAQIRKHKSHTETAL